MGSIPCYSHSQVVYVCQSFRPISFFSGKSPVLGFLLNTEGVWPYRYAHDVPLVTLILNIHGFVGLAPFYFAAKSTFLGGCLPNCVCMPKF